MVDARQTSIWEVAEVSKVVFDLQRGRVGAGLLHRNAARVGKGGLLDCLFRGILSWARCGNGYSSQDRSRCVLGDL